MESQALINIGIAVAGGLGAWVLNRLTVSLDRIDADIKLLPDKYVRKDDYVRDIGEIKSMLKGIYDKLDAKADK
jgi:hypothetical protein